MVTLTTTASSSARYFIVQHVPNPLRREPRNVGVVVEKAGQYLARFVGEVEGNDGQIDRRSTRFLEFPDVYEQWVRYWRRAIDKGGDVVHRLTKANGGHYNIIDGGFVAGTGDDQISVACQYAYSLLVTEDGFAEALGYPDEGVRGNENLKAELYADLKSLGLIGQSLNYPAPIMHNAPLAGEHETYLYSFVHKTRERLRIYEPINLASRQKVISRDHAYWMASAFADTKLRHANLEAIAIARYRPSDMSDDNVKSAFRVLENNAVVLDWNSTSVRRKFLGECESLALAG